MPDIVLSDLGRTEVTLDATYKPDVIVPDITTAPGGLYPFHSSSFLIPEYRIMAGWPVAVPDYDVHANTLVSANGQVLSNRDDPALLRTSALVRWCAGDSYDTTRNTWSPTQGPADLTWLTSSDYSPVLIQDYQYTVKDEVFTMDALNFDSDTQNHMWLDLGAYISPGGYSVVLVLSPNSFFGNDDAVPFNGLWCPGRNTVPNQETFIEPTGEHWDAVTLQGNYLYYQSDEVRSTRTVSCATPLNSSIPSYLVLNFARPFTTIYVATGPSSIRSMTVRSGDTPVPLNASILLGRSNGDVRHTADMALFDVGVYATVLSDDEVRAEITSLAQVYGGQ